VFRHHAGKLRLIVLLTVYVSICACERSPSRYPAASDSAVDRVIREAPGDWDAFEAWVIEEIQTIRPPVPLPQNPVLAEPRQPCVRLDRILHQAEIDSVWMPTADDDRASLNIGPFRSDSLSARFTAGKSFDRVSGRSLQMTMTGFHIPAEEVGKLRFRLRAPYGEYIDIDWGPGSGTRLPISRNDEMLTLELATNGLTSWEGLIRRLTIRTDGYEVEDVFEIESISFLGAEDAFPRPVGSGRFSVGRERRSIVYAHCPSEISFHNLSVPPDGKLTVGLAAANTAGSKEEKTAQVRFQVVVAHAGERETVLERRIAAGGRWHDEAVTLARWGGEKISLTLINDSDYPGATALWSNPVLYQPAPDPPIVILYLIDTMGARHCSLYGYERPTTPALEALARRGVWFANMYADSPVTVSSVPDTQLSMPAERHGVYHTSVRAPAELVTLADALSAAGFATASFITNANAGERQGMDQGFDEYFPQALFFWMEEDSRNRSVQIAEVMDWFSRHSDRPTFAYIHTCEPHAPYTPPPGYKGRFDSDYEGPLNGTIDANNGYPAAKAPREIEYIRALYDEECLYADARLGLFLKRMNGAGLGDRVNIFVIADHGEELQEHGHWGHGLGLYDEVLRVPLIATGPLVTARGRNCLPVCLYDVMPTILDLLDVPQPYELFGVSLRTLMRTDAGPTAPELSPARTTFTSHHRYLGRGQIEYAVVEALKWKLHYRFMLKDEPDYPKPARFELYDLENDPYETRNLIEQRRDIARRLMCKLAAYSRSQHPYASTGGSASFDADQLRDLRVLGYIETKAEAIEGARLSTQPAELSGERPDPD